MKAAAIIAMLAVSMLLAGCSQPAGDDVPPYEPGSVQPQDSGQELPPAQPNATVNGTPGTNEPPPVWDRPANETIEIPDKPTIANKTDATADNKTVEIAKGDPCAPFLGEQMLNCVAQEAIDSKNVVICTQITDKDMRYKCINKWCSSSGRDYRACDRLKDYNDRMGCLNKCNPNANT